MEEKTALPQEDVQEVADTPSVKKKPPFWKNKKKLSLVISMSIMVMIVLVIAVLLDLHYNQPQDKQSEAANCAPDSNLVNPCRPWFGAAVAGDPAAPSFSQQDQFAYLEKQIGQPVDFYRQYHTCSMNAAKTSVSCTIGLPLTQGTAEYQFATRANTYVDVNWKPADTWAEAGGTNQVINNEIKQVADNIKAIAPKKVILTVWHEPQNDVTAGTDGCTGAAHGSAGSPAQYNAMWQNVENIFKNQNVTNVVWAVNYMSTPQADFDCQVPQLWPGASLVNWVLVDVYGTDTHPTWADSTGRLYSYLTALASSHPAMNLNSKPWGLGEFGTCGNSNNQSAIQYYQDAKTAFDNKTYPNLKLYMVWNDDLKTTSSECLTDFDPNGNPAPAKQAAFDALVNAILNYQSSTPTPTQTTQPTPTPNTQPTLTPPSGNPSGRVHVSGTSIIDGSGQHIHLAGVDEGGHLVQGSSNTKDSCGNVWSAANASDIAAMHQMGFNTDRIGVSWSNLEPTAPTVNPDGSLTHHWNTQYLAAVDSQVQMLRQNNMMAIIDMHQAEWSPYFTSGKLCEGTGMPKWLYTTVPNTSGGVDTAKCEFFSDRAETDVKEKPQEGMAAAWNMLAGRYAGNTTVIGADEFNEPLFSKSCSGADLAAFYEKMGGAIRSSNPNIILMYEDNAYDSYMASGSRLNRKPNLSNALFSWHLYAPDWATAQPPMAAHLALAKSWNVPLWIGESDAMQGTRSNSMTAAQQQSLTSQMNYFKQNDISWTLWAYDTGCCSVVVKGSTQPKQPLLSILKLDE